MNAHRALIALTLGVFTATPAWADKPAYCAAYATDFANARAKEKLLWQHKYDIALEACLQTEKIKAISDGPAPKILTPKVKKIVAEKSVPEPAAAPAVTATKLVVGSDDWKIYCANKYTSFNPKTGTYMSKTGVERKCTVSPS